MNADGAVHGPSEMDVERRCGTNPNEKHPARLNSRSGFARKHLGQACACPAETSLPKLRQRGGATLPRQGSAQTCARHQHLVANDRSPKRESPPVAPQHHPPPRLRMPVDFFHRLLDNPAPILTIDITSVPSPNRDLSHDLAPETLDSALRHLDQHADHAGRAHSYAQGPVDSSGLATLNARPFPTKPRPLRGFGVSEAPQRYPLCV